MNAFRPLAALGLLLAAAPAAAQIPVDVPAFDSIGLRGGGRVVVRHGPQQSVTLVRGDLETTRFTVRHDGKLEIDACVRSCRDYDLLVEIVTPELDGVGIEGGGAIRAEGAFPRGGELALGVDGGGTIDMIAVEASSVAAGIDGGGTILAYARDRLVAGINGGGAIRYRGDPSVTAAIDGGGTVNALRP
jgi:hypothetical protein